VLIYRMKTGLVEKAQFGFLNHLRKVHWSLSAEVMNLVLGQLAGAVFIGFRYCGYTMGSLCGSVVIREVLVSL
jgi:hypothetical protein